MVPAADEGVGPGGEALTETGRHCHAEHDGKGHFAGPAMLLGPHWSSSGVINDVNRGSNTSKTASGVTITSGVLDEHGKCIVPRSSRRDGGGSSSDYLQPAPITHEQADQIQYDAMSGPSPEGDRVGQTQAPITQAALIHDPSGRAGQLLDVFREHKPWGPSGRAVRMWGVLRGRDQRGHSGRAAQLQEVIDQGPGPLYDPRLHAIPNGLVTDRDEDIPWGDLDREERAMSAQFSSGSDFGEIGVLNHMVENDNGHTRRAISGSSRDILHATAQQQALGPRDQVVSRIVCEPSVTTSGFGMCDGQAPNAAICRNTIPPLPPSHGQVMIGPTLTMSGFGIGIGPPLVPQALSERSCVCCDRSTGGEATMCLGRGKSKHEEHRAVHETRQRTNGECQT
jgi:hypothetical protein